MLARGMSNIIFHSNVAYVSISATRWKQLCPFVAVVCCLQVYARILSAEWGRRWVRVVGLGCTHPRDTQVVCVAGGHEVRLTHTHTHPYYSVPQRVAVGFRIIFILCMERGCRGRGRVTHVLCAILIVGWDVWMHAVRKSDVFECRPCEHGNIETGPVA